MMPGPEEQVHDSLCGCAATPVAWTPAQEHEALRRVLVEMDENPRIRLDVPTVRWAAVMMVRRLREVLDGT